MGEGKETEPNYFRALRSDDRVRGAFKVTVKKGNGGSPTDVVNNAAAVMAREGDYDEIWCVLDADGARPALESARTNARKNEISLCFSNPAFEVWFLSHFEETSRAFASSSRVVAALNKHWEPKFGAKYAKADSSIYTKLEPLRDEAIKTAKHIRETLHRDDEDILDCNSATEVYKFVSRLLSGSQ